MLFHFVLVIFNIVNEYMHKSEVEMSIAIIIQKKSILTTVFNRALPEQKTEK